MTPLRILHVVVSDQFAGVEQFVRRLAAVQAADGHRVFVAGGAPEQVGDPLRAAGVRFAPAATTFEAIRAIRSADADVVNSHMTSSDVAAVAGRMLGHRRPALVSTRHFALRRGTHGPSAAYRLVERMLDAEISVSRAVADSILVPSTIVHSGVAAVEPAGVRREKTVLMAQRLQPEKDTALGLRAFAASRLADDGWRLEIAGSGAQQEQLRAMAADLGIADAVAFLGFRSDLPALMQQAGMLLATTPNEGLGLTVVEAMASGLPVVASASGGHLDTLGSIDGSGLYAMADADAAAERLSALARDPDERSRLADAQLSVQRRSFTLRSQADGTEAVYRQAIARREAKR